MLLSSGAPGTERNRVKVRHRLSMYWMASPKPRVAVGLLLFGRVLLKLLPILRDPPRHPAQQMAGQVPDPNPRQDYKARVEASKRI
jgi:hypothetical protein